MRSLLKIKGIHNDRGRRNQRERSRNTVLALRTGMHGIIAVVGEMTVGERRFDADGSLTHFSSPLRIPNYVLCRRPDARQSGFR